jgi:hypothetical protein
MTTSSTHATPAASAESPMPERTFDYVRANDIFGALSSGASISIEEFPKGEIVEAARVAERRASSTDGVGAVVIDLSADVVGGAPNDTVWFHPDEDARLDIIARARAALDNAEAALDAVGYQDKVHLCGSDYRTAQERERNAFELGRDSIRGQQPA